MDFLKKLLDVLPSWFFAASLLGIVGIVIYMIATGSTFECCERIHFVARSAPQEIVVKYVEKDGERNVQAPHGTKRDDWDIVVLPLESGLDEPNSESDNALIKIETRADALAGTNDSWHIVAIYRYREGSDVRNAPLYPARAEVLLIPKHMTAN